MSIRITNNIDLSCKECKKLEQENARLRELLSKAIDVVAKVKKSEVLTWSGEEVDQFLKDAEDKNE